MSKKISKKEINQIMIDVGFDDVQVNESMSKKELSDFLDGLGFDNSEIKDIVESY